MHDHGHETLYIDSDIHESWVMGIGPWATLCDIMNVLNLGNLFFYYYYLMIYMPQTSKFRYIT